MSKKLFKNLMLVIAMTILCFAVAMTASAETTEDGFSYNITNEKVTIIGYEGIQTDVIIPDKIEGFPVVNIGDSAFKNKTLLTSVTFPENLINIGNFAFSGCSGLTGDLIIPEGVTKISYGAFSGCDGFTGKLVIPEGVTNIEHRAFFNCSGFTGELIIPKSVTSIGQYAFNYCSGFTGDLIIPKSLKNIDMCAFLGCSGFTGSLTIPEGVTNIGEWAFYGCSGFTGDLIIPEGITSIGEYTFKDCKGFTGDLIIPEGMTEIGYGAFADCSGFAGNLIIPNSIISIDDSAFYNCKNLKHICYNGTEEQWNSIVCSTLSNTPYIHFYFDSEADISEVVIPSTCLTEGTKATVCSCSYTYSTETLPLADCSFTTYTSDNNATCLADGTKTAYCDYGCSNSNTITDKASAFGHDMSEYVVTKEVTCTVNGEERADCARCDYYETKELIANNHKDENLDGNCDYCNENIADKVCLCVCHAKTIGAFVYKLFKAIDKIFKTRLIEKVFGITDICVCGIKH